MDDVSRGAATLAPAFAAWRSEPDLAAALSDARAVRLVLDADGSRVLDASAEGHRLVERLGGSGALPPDLSGQILRSAGAAPRLMRLRLDRRGVAAPVLCRFARAQAGDGRPAFLLVVAGPLPPARAPAPRPAAPAPAREPGLGPHQPPRPLPAPGRRFLWRTDAEGVLTALSDGQDALADLVGQSWEALAAAGRIGGAAEALLAALADRRTFRAVRVEVRVGAALAVDLSGAPSAGPGRAFAGFGGFGIVRTGAEVASPAEPSRVAAAAASQEPPATTASLAPALPSDPITLATMAAPIFAAWIGQTWFGAPLPRAGSGAAEPTRPERAPPEPTRPERAPPEPTRFERALPEPTHPEPAAPEAEASEKAVDAVATERVAAPEPVAAAGPAPEPGLSHAEHAAFREIARALGARYAGDDDAQKDGPEARPEGGSVTPFPGARPAETDPAVILEGIPAAVLVRRGDAVLAANRALLGLAGYPDLASLQAAGLGRLFRGLSPDRHVGAGGEPVTVAIEAADGTGRPVLLGRAPMAWPGGPADCLLLRPVPAEDPQGRRAAEDLARRVREARGADALAVLDVLDDSVAVLDGAGRVLALNRAAADLFICDAREVVGGAFAALFGPESVPAVQAALDGASGPEKVVVAGRSLDLRVTPVSDDRRAALLRLPEAGPRTAHAFASGFLGTLDRGIRTPLTGILGFADVTLKEPYGPLGHPRYRAYLKDIRASGEQVLDLVTDLIDLASIEAGGLVLVRRRLPLNDLIAACVAELQPEAARSRIVLRTSFADDLATLEADEPSIARAARIVIGNAIRRSVPGGQVIVSTSPAEAGAVAVRVRDTGPGLSPEEVAFALEPFAGEAAARSETGGGLGLPLTRALVEANDGTLHIASRKDEGTLIEIRLPAARAARRA